MARNLGPEPPVEGRPRRLIRAGSRDEMDHLQQRYVNLSSTLVHHGRSEMKIWT